ncbi:MAG: hypothetical protein JW838_05545 [Spirochaetes bacterium]|nr:hypothetical protein [Spirochaetota bacterium]
MKKLFAVLMIAGIAFMFTNCKTTTEEKGVGDLVEAEWSWDGFWKVEKHDGVTVDAFYCLGEGIYTVNDPKTGEEMVPAQQRLFAKRAAVLDAQYKVLGKIVGEKFQGASGMENFKMSGYAAAAEVYGTIKGGKIAKSRFSDDEQKVEVLYRVAGKGLRKKVEDVKTKVK